MALPSSVRAAGWRTGKRLVDWSAARLKLASYVPLYDYREQLEEQTTLVNDGRPIRDKRPSTVSAENVDLTLTVEGLEDVARGRSWSGLRTLEVGPKYGIHSRWIDRQLTPSALVFSDFEEDRHLHEQWEHELRCPHAWVYGDLRAAAGLTEHGPFDLVLFLGVLYHSAFHLELLGMLNRVTAPGGEMLLETTIDPRPDAAVRVRWQPGTGKAKMVPTFDALRIELAWTGWRDVTVFDDYRPASDEVLLLCRKTDELGEGKDVADVVRPQRGGAESSP
jgi:SAM-dependent methyltransferase